MDPVVVATQQLIERETIAALCGGDQGGVIELARNASSVTNVPEASRDVRTRAGAVVVLVRDQRSTDDGNLAEAAPVRVGVAAGPVATEFLEQDQDVSGRCRRHR
jgi:CTP synthase (UTP-ammonia lyase)